MGQRWDRDGIFNDIEKFDLCPSMIPSLSQLRFGEVAINREDAEISWNQKKRWPPIENLRTMGYYV